MPKSNANNVHKMVTNSTKIMVLPCSDCDSPPTLSVAITLTQSNITNGLMMFMKKPRYTEADALTHVAGISAYNDGSVRDWQAALERAIRLSVEAGHLRPDTDSLQMLFEIHGLILALHYEARFLQTPGSMARAVQGFHNILARYSAAKPGATAEAAPAAAAKRRKVSNQTTTSKE
mgnify:CR=1 FL=1